MPYVGVAPSAGLFKKLDSITTVNAQAAYTMQHNSANFAPATAEQLIVSVNGVIQAPGDAFTISGSTITFSENLVTGDVIDFIIALGEVGNTVTPTDGSVDINKMSTSIMKVQRYQGERHGAGEQCHDCGRRERDGRWAVHT